LPGPAIRPKRFKIKTNDKGYSVELKKVWWLFVCLAFLSLPAAADNFTLKDSKGKVHTLAGYKGKWVLVNFWATWCPPCLEEIPDLVSLQEKHKDLAIIGIAMDYQDPKQVVDFADNMLINYPIVLGNEQIVSQIGSVSGLPTTYLYDLAGKKVAYNVGALTKEAVEKFIAKKTK
jgi:thiol-disulfide isomerase/thioredoxin